MPLWEQDSVRAVSDGVCVEFFHLSVQIKFGVLDMQWLSTHGMGFIE